MPGVIANELGKINIGEDIIANIAGHAATESCGVVGMNSKTATDALLKIVGGEANRKCGVKVSFDEEGSVVIDLFVTMIFGVSLPVVAQNMIDNVKYQVSDMTGLKVNTVNIHVESVTNG